MVFLRKTNADGRKCKQSKKSGIDQQFNKIDILNTDSENVNKIFLWISNCKIKYPGNETVRSDVWSLDVKNTYSCKNKLYSNLFGVPPFVYWIITKIMKILNFLKIVFGNYSCVTPGEFSMNLFFCKTNVILLKYIGRDSKS